MQAHACERQCELHHAVLLCMHALIVVGGLPTGLCKAQVPSHPCQLTCLPQVRSWLADPLKTSPSETQVLLGQRGRGSLLESQMGAIPYDEGCCQLTRNLTRASPQA